MAAWGYVANGHRITDPFKIWLRANGGYKAPVVKEVRALVAGAGDLATDFVWAATLRISPDGVNWCRVGRRGYANYQARARRVNPDTFDFACQALYGDPEADPIARASEALEILGWTVLSASEAEGATEPVVKEAAEEVIVE
jgi:hypothetical protein